MKFIYPVKGIGISQTYSRTHPALDLGWNNNYGGKTAPITSAGDGFVYDIDTEPHGGKVIVIDHGNGYYSKYGHLSKILVHQGQKVNCMGQIGNMGNTGIDRETGERVAYHLHFELYKGKYSKSYKVNPLDYLFVDPSQTVLSRTEANYKDVILKYGESRVCTGNGVRIRTEPKLTSKVTSHLNKGDQVKIYEYENGFFRTHPTSKSWVAAKFLKRG